LRVESARYGDRLTVSFTVDAAVDATSVLVPMLLLQPLVENAVKHGIAPRASGGSVAVRVVPEARGLAVIIEDDGVGFGNSAALGNGRALTNCKERLRLTYGEGATLDLAPRVGGGTRAHLSLPTTVTT
jgi:LytS/YehU family sensor histidine kinase